MNIGKELLDELLKNAKQFTFDRSLKELIIHEKTGQLMASLKEQGAISIYV